MKKKMMFMMGMMAMLLTACANNEVDSKEEISNVSEKSDTDENLSDDNNSADPIVDEQPEVLIRGTSEEVLDEENLKAFFIECGGVKLCEYGEEDMSSNALIITSDLVLEWQFDEIGDLGRCATIKSESQPGIIGNYRIFFQAGTLDDGNYNLNYVAYFGLADNPYEIDEEVFKGEYSGELIYGDSVGTITVNIEDLTLNKYGFYNFSGSVTVSDSEGNIYESTYSGGIINIEKGELTLSLDEAINPGYETDLTYILMFYNRETGMYDAYTDLKYDFSICK